MSVSRRWTVADLEQLELKETERYEIIDGELIVTSAPSWEHQSVCTRVGRFLDVWSESPGLGVATTAPGVIFSPENAVIPDLAWISFERLRRGRDRAGHFTRAPELMIEVLSPGASNERRDRDLKMALYARECVDQYWIVDWRQRTVEVYAQAGGTLEHLRTLADGDTLETPLLPGFALDVGRIWPPTL